MPWVNEIKFAKNEIDTVEEWNGIWNQEWDIHHEWNEIHFISFTVADQDASQQLSRIHDVDGSYELHNPRITPSHALKKRKGEKKTLVNKRGVVSKIWALGASKPNGKKLLAGKMKKNLPKNLRRSILRGQPNLEHFTVLQFRTQ